MPSVLKNLGIAIGIAVLLYILHVITSFFGVTFYNNSITVFCGIWFITLLFFYIILPKDYMYFTGKGDIPF